MYLESYKDNFEINTYDHKVIYILKSQRWHW